MVLNYIYTDRIDPTKRPDDKVEDPQSNRIVLLMMDVYRLAVQFNMERLEQLCVNYLEATISHANVLEALRNAVHLNLYFIKEFCLSFVVKEINYNLIVMSQEFETLDQPLMVEIIRRRQMPQTRTFMKYEYESVTGRYHARYARPSGISLFYHGVCNTRNQPGARHGSVLEECRSGILWYYVATERYADTGAQGHPRSAMQLFRSNVSIFHAWE